MSAQPLNREQWLAHCATLAQTYERAMTTPFIIRRVKNAFEYTFSAGRNRVQVPAGARVVRAPDGRLWVDHNAFDNGIDRHDAEYYGVPVAADNIDEEGY